MVAGGGFEPPTSGLCLLLQLSLPGEPVCSLDFPFTLGRYPLGCLTSSLYTFSFGLHVLQSFARDYPANGFPEFVR